MGIPYSKQIDAAFDQVTPLVASAYEVLETTKNIALIILGIQILMIVLLTSILLAMIGLLFSLNPDLENERKALVTPVMQWIASWTIDAAGRRKSILGTVVGILILVGLGIWGYLYYDRQAVKELIGQEGESESKNEGKEPAEGADADKDQEATK